MTWSCAAGKLTAAHFFHKSIKRNEFVREYKRTKSSKYGRIFKSHKTVCVGVTGRLCLKKL